LSTSTGQPLYWDGSYAIAKTLALRYPAVDLEEVTLSMIEQWTLVLPDFVDDPEMVNDDLLKAIYQDWYEEVNPI